MAMEKVNTKEQLSRLNELLNDSTTLQKEAEDDLLALQISNAEKLLSKKKELLNKEATERKNLEQKTLEILLVQEQKEREALKKNDLRLNEEQYKQELKLITEKYKKDGALYKSQLEKNAKVAEEAKKKADKKAAADAAKALKERSKNEENYENGKLLSKKAALEKQAQKLLDNPELGFTSKAEAIKAIQQESKTQNLTKAINALSNFAKQLDSTVKDIAESQTKIDTRLQGSRNSQLGGSYWKQMEWNIGSNIGISPLVKQSDVVGNLKSMVGQGIAYNVEQRAFLETIKESIADTFSATNGTLLRLVRIQQEDTTAARLGMESALTSFLNNMYETTEYMTQQANTIKASLEEASALMTAKSATEFEYQVQKWMGSLYSVGFDNTSGLSSALGQLASGDISSINNGGFGNLLVMAANKANLSVADMLANGLDSSDTNQLMQAMVEYLGQIYSETKGSNILAQQYANVFGLKASDLKAAANLAKSTGSIAGNNLNYGGMLGQLTNMANSMYSRMSTGALMTNAYENVKYNMAASIGANPLLYSIWAASNILDDTVNGIEFGTPLVMGSGSTQTFKVSDIMKIGALGGSLLGATDKLIGSLSTSGGFSGSGLLKAFGIDTSNVVSRGISTGTSESGSIIANGDSSSITSKTMTDQADQSKQQTVSASEESSEATMTDVNENVVMIYNLLNKVTGGGDSFKVDVGDSTTWTNVFKAGSLF